MPEVTIITPTYRGTEQELLHSIGSVIAQTFTDWVQVVCSDGVREIIPAKVVMDRADPRVTYRVSSKEHRDYGPGVRNEVLETVDTKWVCFLDDDNLLMPEYLQEMLQAAKIQDADFAVCECLHYGPLNMAIHGRPPAILTGVPPKLYSIDTIQVLVKTSVLRSAGGFALDRDNKGYYGDGVTYERLASKFRYAVVPRVLAVHM